VFKKTLLDSGVRVLTEAVPTVRSVAVGLWVHTGSRDEEDSQAGISHFLEHMVFKGTRKRRMHHIARRLESVGGYLNAFTSKEYTCFEARVLDTHLARAVDTLSDLVVDPLFPERELEKERGVVLEEMKMYQDMPEDLILEWFEQAVYPDHALGRPIIGYPETVSAFSRTDLLDYLGHQYTPDRLVLAAAGNLKHEAVVRVARRALEGLRPANGLGIRREVGLHIPRSVVEERPVQQGHLVIGRRGLKAAHDQQATLRLLNTILGGGMSSRLNQGIREKYGFCYNVFSFISAYSDTGDLGIYVGADGDHMVRVEKLIFRECAKLADHPVSARTLKQARNQVKGGILMGLESMSSRMARIARQELLLGRHITLEDMIAALDAVTTEDVQSLATELFLPAAFSRVAMIPTA